MRTAYSVLRVVAKLAIFVCVLGALAFAGITLFGTLRGGAGGTPIGMPGLPAGGSSDLTEAERVALSAYLNLNAAGLQEPAGSDDTPVKFTVAPGDTASAIANRLATAGFIKNADLFRNYMRYYGLDSQIEAGDFMLRKTMTIPQVAATLGRALAPDVELRITEGWRAEQVASAVAGTEGVTITVESFMDLVKPGADLDGYNVSVVGYLPQGASLEGFLFPDTYRIPRNATARDVVERMLRNFDQRIAGAELADGFAAQDLTMYEGVTLASIVEREAVIPDERPLIASVYLNRLRAGMKLDADPTVQYALGYQADSGQWWKRPLLLEDLQFASPYNTYLNAGLPPGPIASPGLASLQAVAAPAVSDFLYFRAACDGSGRHNFAATFEQHQANACP